MNSGKQYLISAEAPPLSKPKFAVRTQPDEPQGAVIRLLVVQHQIRPDMAIAVAFAITGQCVVAEAFGERVGKSSPERGGGAPKA